jgi:ribonuclease HI
MGLMQQPSENSENIKSYLDTVVPPASATDLSPLDTRITTTEITEAIKRCKHGKAQGPDELNNDWYRDHLDQLVPLFDKLFNLWFEQGVTPLSFHEANVQCLKKTRTASRPLDHRPIALLNSDYKVYTKIFSSRLRLLLPDLIHPLQAGFVPGRSIHTPIDTFLAIRKLAGKETKLAKAIGLLLDFAKAYDSLSRPFLLCVLRLYGFPQQFVDMVAALHDETSVRFLVNGYLSKSVNVTCGIRQGCPLAPLLFIIAIDILYRVVEASPDLEGVRIIGAELDTTVKISGYADDTALYVTDDSKIPQVISLLDQFGHYSGLRVNLEKSVGVLMCENGATEEVRGCGISILPVDDTCRYLGIQVGTRDAREANWNGCVDALRVRLALAFAKTHSVIQRAEIARAVIIPKLLYLARHAWPTESTVTELHKFIKSFVWGKINGRTRRAWVSEERAELPLHAGGISMPNVRTELLTLSANTMGKWADNSNTFERLIGDILLDSEQIQNQYITPRSDAKLSLQTMGTSLWATGTSIMRHVYARTHTDEDIRGIRACAETIMRGYDTAEWHCGQLVIDVGELISPAVTARIAHAKKCYGAFCEEWLQMCSTSEDGWLLDRKGTVYDLSKARISNGCVSLRDLVRWTWVRRGRVLFEYVPGHEFATAPSIRSFQRLCFALLYNFPQLLFRPTRFLQLEPYDARIQQHHEWRLEGPNSLQHYDATILTGVHGVHRSSELGVVAAQDSRNRGPVLFHAHPWFTRLVQIYGGHQRWTVSRRHLKRYLARKRNEVGRAQRDKDSESSAQPVQSQFSSGLKQLKWIQVHKLIGMNTYERQLIFRLKAGKISTWNHRDGNKTCPYPSCRSPGDASLEHIFWTCPQAQAVWQPMLSQWTRLGVTLADDPAADVFSLQLPTAPIHAWQLMGNSQAHGALAHELQDALFPAAQTLWQFMCGTTIASVWYHRISEIHDHQDSTEARRAMSSRRLLSGLRNLRRLLDTFAEGAKGASFVSMVQLLSEVLIKDALPPIEQRFSGTNEFILFFDGGSRGNPGPGGAGSVILRLDRIGRRAHLVWAASMAYGQASTTNNTAEYWGLINGLRYAKAHQCQPLHVVGDSAMIIRQQQLHYPPKNRRLASMYHWSKRLADTMAIRSWSHHYRSFNKMADKAANHAMDSSVSAQYRFPTDRREGAELASLMVGDTQHWFDNHPTASGVDRLSRHDQMAVARPFMRLMC